jgi:hypothetical protein
VPECPASLTAKGEWMENPEKGLRATSQRSQSQRNSSQRGWYLLEYAVVTFGLAVFIVGLSDISRIFHARGAVRAGVTEGLRCLYPTDPGCTEQSLDRGWFPSDRFTARITGDQTNKYELPRVAYSLSSAWFNEPVSEAQFATKQLTAVTLTQPHDAYRQYQVLFPGVAHAVYLLKTQELPRVYPGGGSSPESRLRNPRFIDPATGGERAVDLNAQPPALALSVGSSTTTEWKSVSIRIPEAKVVPGPFGGASISSSTLRALESGHGFTAACYEGARVSLSEGGQGIQWPNSGTPASCTYRIDDIPWNANSQLQVPIVIHVTGSGYIKGTKGAVDGEWKGIIGKVEMELWQDGRRILELGGRVFGRGEGSGEKQVGDFVVRGAGTLKDQLFDVSASYAKDCEDSSYTECRTPAYVRLPLVRVGSDLAIRFRLLWLTNSAYDPNWRPSLPAGSKEKVDRSKPYTRKVQVQWANSNVSVFFPKFQATHEQKSCGYSSTPNSCGVSATPMQVAFRTTNLDQSFSHSQRSETLCGREQPTGYRASIPEALESIRGEIKSGARRLEPVAFWSHGAAADSCDARVSSATCVEQPREYMKGCEPQYSMPSDAVQYCNLPDYQPVRDTISNPRFRLGASTRVDTRGGCTGEPFPECAKNDLVSKGYAFLGAVSNGCRVAQPVNASLESRGPVFENTCVDELAQFIKEYREKHKVPDSIAINSLVSRETPVIADAPPSNSCWKHNPIDGRPGQSWLCADQASYVVANKCCEKYGAANCSLERVVIGGGGGDKGSFNQIVEGARERTLQTVQAAYPPAKMDLTCGVTPDGEPSEDDCIAIQAGPAGNGTQARVQASMRVPLALFDWFGMENHTVVQYEETRTLESSLVGDVG